MYNFPRNPHGAPALPIITGQHRTFCVLAIAQTDRHRRQRGPSRATHTTSSPPPTSVGPYRLCNRRTRARVETRNQLRREPHAPHNAHHTTQPVQPSLPLLHKHAQLRGKRSGWSDPKAPADHPTRYAGVTCDLRARPPPGGTLPSSGPTHEPHTDTSKRKGLFCNTGPCPVQTAERP